MASTQRTLTRRLGLLAGGGGQEEKIEADLIGMSDDECLMNSKSEFHQAPLVRVVATTGLQDGQEERLDAVRGRGGGRGRAGRRNRGA